MLTKINLHADFRAILEKIIEALEVNQTTFIPEIVVFLTAIQGLITSEKAKEIIADILKGIEVEKQITPALIELLKALQAALANV